MTHASKSGVATFVARRRQGVPRRRALPAQLPAVEQPRGAAAPSTPTDDPERLCPELVDLMPASARTSPYDMKKVIAAVVDDGEFFEYFPHWAPTSCAASPGSTASPSASSATSR